MEFIGGPGTVAIRPKALSTRERRGGHRGVMPNDEDVLGVVQRAGLRVVHGARLRGIAIGHDEFVVHERHREVDADRNAGGREFGELRATAIELRAIENDAHLHAGAGAGQEVGHDVTVRQFVRRDVELGRALSMTLSTRASAWPSGEVAN